MLILKHTLGYKLLIGPKLIVAPYNTTWYKPRFSTSSTLNSGHFQMVSHGIGMELAIDYPHITKTTQSPCHLYCGLLSYLYESCLRCNNYMAQSLTIHLALTSQLLYDSIRNRLHSLVHIIILGNLKSFVLLC